MPLIAEIVLAVSVGCVEIRNSTATQEGYEMDSYQVSLHRTHTAFSHLPVQTHNLAFKTL